MRILAPITIATLGLACGKSSTEPGLCGTSELVRQYETIPRGWHEPAVDTTPAAQATARPSAWYEQWWPWVLIGTAVAGGITATVLVARDTPDSGDVNISVRQPQ